jgi:hypothetical protein
MAAILPVRATVSIVAIINVGRRLGLAVGADQVVP